MSQSVKPQCLPLLGPSIVSRQMEVTLCTCSNYLILMQKGLRWRHNKAPCLSGTAKGSLLIYMGLEGLWQSVSIWRPGNETRLSHYNGGSGSIPAHAVACHPFSLPLAPAISSLQLSLNKQAAVSIFRHWKMSHTDKRLKRFNARQRDNEDD